MNVLDLFSGIGGFSLGLERAGMRTVAFCEIDEKAREVLEKHWPHVYRYTDIRELTAARLTADGISVDVICGGFPCQDISFAGKGAGIEGERSGLWSEYARIIGELRPRYVIVENVSALLSRGLDRVLGDLAALGYDAEWHCIRAADLGAPHLRDRIWIVAYPQHSDPDSQRSHREGMHIHGGVELRDEQECQPGSVREDVANAHQPRLERWLRRSLQECASERLAWQDGPPVSDTDRQQMGWTTESWPERCQWLFEPPVGRVANGISGRVDRLKQLGNAVVPQIPEIIGRAIMSASTLTSQQGNCK